MIRIVGKTFFANTKCKLFKVYGTPVTYACFLPREFNCATNQSISQTSMRSDTVLRVPSNGVITTVVPLICCARGYAKRGNHSKKESSKQKTKSDKPHAELSPEELNEIVNFDKMKNQMELTLNHLTKEYTDQLAVRVSLGMLGGIIVETTDGSIPLNQLGQIFQKTPQLMMVNLIDSPQHIDSVNKAIIGSGININPQQEGTMLYLPIPKVTKEHRENLAKSAKMLCEKTKEKLRNIQNNYVRDLKKVKDQHSADLIFNLNEEILVMAKSYMAKAEEIMEEKQKELLGS